MDIINNDELRRVYHCVCTIDNILDKSIQIAAREKSYIDQMVPDDIRNIYSTKRHVAQNFVTDISRISYDSSLIMLVATFEKIVFAKYKTSYGILKSYVGNIPATQMDYFKSREKFVSGAIDKLHAIIDLINGYTDNELIKKLTIIKAHRDYIAHGKRFGESPIYEFTLDEVAVILDKIISEIEKN